MHGIVFSNAIHFVEPNSCFKMEASRLGHVVFEIKSNPNLCIRKADCNFNHCICNVYSISFPADIHLHEYRDGETTGMFRQMV